MRVPVCFAGGRGHLLPLLPLARALRDSGHRIALSGQADVVAGFDDRTTFTDLLPHEPVVSTSTGPAGTGVLAVPGLAHERAVVGRWYAGTLARRTLPQTGARIGSWRPDLVVCDEVDFGSVAAAVRAGVPCVVVDVIATGGLTDPAYVAEPLAELGLAADRVGDLRIAPFPRSWRASPTAPDVVHVRPQAPPEGPAHPAARWLGEGRAGAAYLTLGTIFNRESGDLFSRLLGGLLGLPGRVLATIGPDLDPRHLGAEPSGPGDPGELRVERWVPQEQVLVRADVMVCHGGSGSVMGALAHATPLVVVAMGADQELNAARVEALGAGVRLDPRSCTPAQVREAVEHVRHDPAVRVAVARLRAEIASLPLVASLVPRLEALAASDDHEARRRRPETARDQASAEMWW